MASEIKVDTIVNAGGDNDTGIDLATNDQILLKVANSTKLTMNSTGQTTIVGEGGTTTTNLQQGLNKAYCTFAQSSSHTINDSFNISGLNDDGAGSTTVSYTNVFSVAKHPLVGTSNWNGVFTHDTYTTGSNQIRGRGADSTSLQDRGTLTMLCGGSLA